MSTIREIVILSGKGGTGKTSLVASLALLFKEKILVDCDVDAANLNLIINARVTEEQPFVAGSKATIQPDACTACGKCREVCRFEAISKNFVVDPLACEGCGACYFFCPESAVAFDQMLAGHLYVGETDEREMVVFAELLPGGENTGKLVAAVRTRASELAERRQEKLILIDGPPGIGCPVISCLTGCYHALIVTEPTCSGVHDMERAVELGRHFGIPMSVVVNKSDINAEHTRMIEEFCGKEGMTFLGGIPFDSTISEAQRQAKTILELVPNCGASRAIRDISRILKERMEVV